MQSRTALIGTFALSAAIILLSPRLALTPGPLTAGHATIASSCLSCHSMFQGAPAAKCSVCHALDSIGIARRALKRLGQVRPALAGMHTEFRNADCLDCHTDHLGVDPALATHAFSHEALGTALRGRCSGCHATARPADELHRQVGDDCATCHTTRAWTPAAFDHDALGVALQQRCATCHTTKRPADDLHRQVGDDCATCHTTRAWAPASFRHDQYFLLDRAHDVRCRTCHAEPPGYRQYTCYGCHAHTPANIADKHREEGIMNLTACARCHRSADEHEGGERD